MRLALACDHADIGFARTIEKFLTGNGHEVTSFIPEEGLKVDYPEYAKKAAELVAEGVCCGAVLICGTGAGMSIAANKIAGIRAVCCSESYTARLSKEHNNANVLCLGVRVVGVEVAKDIVNAWLSADFEGERHARRVAMLED